ncbi:MAG: helix-turn-helix transcriptional regulator [Salinibacterium sp.]|nr:helix-turn-helix transcriptional regulator [Salinibacterium sp.]
MTMSERKVFDDHSGPRTVNAAQVWEAKAAMPANNDIDDLADVFHLLGDPNRVKILIALSGGRMAVRDLAAVVELSESAVSHALRLLRAHRVVGVEREGRMAYYALADLHVRELLRLALEHIGHSVLLHPAEQLSSTSLLATEECDRPHDSARWKEDP